MSKKLFWGILVCGSMMFTSCATIITGTNAKVSIDGNIDEPVTIVTSYQTYTDQKLPVVVKVKRKKMDGQRIQITSDNYNFRDILLRKSVNSWAFGNILLGGLVGWGVDLITNSVSTPAQDNFYIEGTPKNKETSSESKEE